jgi:hypothetical protein
MKSKNYRGSIIYLFSQAANYSIALWIKVAPAGIFFSGNII